jgi:hypothetical protein
MPQSPDDPAGSDLFGVSGGSPAPDFENLDEDERLLLEAEPFHEPRVFRPGRPRGARNRRTVDMIRLYQASGLPDPLLFQGKLLQAGVDGLARELGCDRLEAADLLAKVADRLAPYFHSKRPTQVELQPGVTPVLVMRELDGVAALPAGTAAGVMSIDDDLVEALGEAEEKQRLRERVASPSHGEASHGEAKAAEPPAKTPATADD